MSRINRTYIPIKDRENFGQLQFPTLRSQEVVAPTLTDMRDGSVSVSVGRRTRAERKVSKANKNLDKKLGATSEFRQVRYNLSYKSIIDIVGEDFPIHPEYLYVMAIILKYYGQTMTDVLEFAILKEGLRIDIGERVSISTRTFNVGTSSCLTSMMYFLYAQYNCNPEVLMQLFGISIPHLRSLVDQFNKQYDNSAVIRADYWNIHGHLKQLEPTK